MTEFRLIPGESFNGVVARWADEVCGFERTSDLAAAAGIQYGPQQQAAVATKKDIRALASFMELDPDELLSRATPRLDIAAGLPRHAFFGTSISTVLLEKRHRRFSPTALTKSAHDRALWSVRLLPFCSETWEVLVDRCPYCGKRLGWKRTLGIAYCDAGCMTDLRTATTTSIPEAIRPPLKEIIGLVDPDPEQRRATVALLPPELARAGPDATLELLTRLVPVMDPKLPGKTTDLVKADPLQLSQALVKAWKVALAWPDAMTAFATKCISERTSRYSDGNSGRTLRFLNPPAHSEHPRLIVPLVKAWRERLDLQGPKSDEIMKATRSNKEAARELGLGSVEVTEIRRAGGLRTVFVLDQGRAVPRFDAAELSLITSLQRARMPIGSARLKLGISCNGVEQLVAMRLIEQERNSFISIRYSDLHLVSSSIDALEDALIAAGEGDPDRCDVTLQQAMKVIGGRQKPWGPAFNALLNGPLTYLVKAGSEPLVRRVMIPRSSLDILGSLTFDPDAAEHLPVPYAQSMSKIDASETLNLGFKQSTPLLKDIETKAGTCQKLVPLTFVLELAATYISSIELAMRRGVSDQRAYHDAIRHGVPNLGHGGFCRATAEQRYFC